MIPNTAPAHVYLGTGQPAVVAAWDDDGYPMIVSPTGLCRADAVGRCAAVMNGWDDPKLSADRIVQLVAAPAELYQSGGVIALALTADGTVHAATCPEPGTIRL